MHLITSLNILKPLKLSSLVVMLFFFNQLSAQLLTKEQLDTCRVYTSLEQALRHPERVYILDLSKQKIKKFPQEILQFKNLNILKLNKNKLDQLPDSLSQLINIQEIELDKNNFSHFPIVLTELINLKKIIISQNEVEEIPFAIKNLKKLEHLDMWSNNLFKIPDSISELENLKVFDLRVIQFSSEEKERLEKLLPNTKIHFSNSCNCGY